MDIDAKGVEIKVRLDTGEAAKLLRGLEAMQDEVGGLAGELIGMLREAGVEAASEKPHRSEYAGPQ